MRKVQDVDTEGSGNSTSPERIQKLSAEGAGATSKKRITSE
jgi:hypothetical protein